ncbi:MAG: type II toxin-antitoxin system prevent-host-death family antitoxin [Candidatus Promineofilum sp.]|nr:type II toxin-antitoxin system prevent-host-death family antitoxin [Promineifilum sp.]
MTQHISSEKARARWREILDSVAAGEEIVIERYGRPVAVIAPYREEAPAGQQVREPAPVYDTAALAQLKAEIIAEVLAELEARPPEPISWREGLAELQRSMANSRFAHMTTDEIVEVTRQTRREIFEAEYAHLYR